MNCALCSAALADHELQICIDCLGRTRRHLADILDAYRELPAILTGLETPRIDITGRNGGDWPAIPGRDVMALLGGGSDGRWAGGQDHASDQRPTDTPSVAWELARWEDDWRQMRGECAASGPAKAETAGAYLGARMGWAAAHHPAFQDFADDLTRLRATLRRATHHQEPSPDGAPCFNCGTTLERRRDEPKPCDHIPPTYERAIIGCDGKGRPVRESLSARDQRIAQWEGEHAACEQGGRRDDYTCPRCGRVYDDPSYWLAVRSQMEDQEAT